jgi:hypothetical protein
MYHLCLLNDPVNDFEPPGFLSHFDELRLALSERLTRLPYELEGLRDLPVLRHLIDDCLGSLVVALVFEVVTRGCFLGWVEYIVDLVRGVGVAVDKRHEFLVVRGTLGGGVEGLGGGTVQGVAELPVEIGQGGETPEGTRISTLDMVVWVKTGRDIY